MKVIIYDEEDKPVFTGAVVQPGDFIELTERAMESGRAVMKVTAIIETAIKE